MITLPPNFKATQLKQIARLCGKSRSGTKGAITARISDDLNNFKPLAPGTRILSIDLGIRNLAYSLLEVPGPHHDASGKKKRKKRATSQDAASLQPILHAWECLALIPKTAPARKKKKKKDAIEAVIKEWISAPVDPSIKTPKSKSKSRKGKKPVEEEPPPDEEAPDDAQATAIAALEADPATTPIPIEDFSPTRLSALAVDLILTRLLPLQPDLVVLEQQRFRSMGGASVLEWTLRVNSLESMLYAVFTTLRQLGQWPGGRLEGVVARNVLEFMAVQEGDGASIWVKTLQGDNKRIKKDIVRKMLSEDGARVRLGEGHRVAEVVKEYVDKWEMKGKRGKTSIGGADGLKKLDDLADCLLQGIAFIRWQANKRKLLAGGVEALADQMVDE